MKFICKDFWTSVFRKQIDNLRTNHQVTQQVETGCTVTCLKNIHPKLLMNRIMFSPLKLHSLTVSFVFQGIYVLQDNMFRLLSQLSAGKQYLDQAPKVRCCRRQELPACFLCVGHVWRWNRWWPVWFCSIWPSPAVWWEELCSVWEWKVL